MDKLVNFYKIFFKSDKEYKNSFVLQHYHCDHLMTSPQMTDESQSIIWQAKYYPFGRIYSQSAEVENNLRFPGQYAEKNLNIYYNWHRYYSPKIGRYIKVDPFIEMFSYQNYFYVKSNPVIKYDLKGLFTIDKSCKCKPYDARKAAEDACQKYSKKLSRIRPDLEPCIRNACGKVKIYCNGCKKSDNHAESYSLAGRSLCPGMYCKITLCKPFGNLTPRYQSCRILHEIMHLCGVGKKGGTYEEIEKEVMELEQKICWGEEITVTP